MRFKLLCLLVVVVLGWAATDATAAPKKKTLLEGPVGLPPPPYTENRWIALLKKDLQVCPPIEGWLVAKLVDLALKEKNAATQDPTAENQQRGQSDLETADSKLLDKLGLERFCVYTAEDAKTDRFPEEALPPGLVKADRDRMALSAMSPNVPKLSAIGDLNWQILADHLLDQIGRVRLARTEKPSVRLVFVDTHPTGEGPPEKSPPPSSWHGYSMAHLAHQLVCGNEESKPCAIKVATRLALRHDQYDPNMLFSLYPAANENGGHFGLVNDLAVAILAEVDHWQKVDPDKKLILDLSVGWDGELHDVKKLSDLDARSVSKLDLPTLAVYKALRYATHRGALVIAAAGNRRGGPEESRWPVLPAAWELRRPSWVPFALCGKRVYAVGGVDWQGLPLPNSRFGGRPRRTAYGDHAVARTWSPDEVANGRPGANGASMIYTGTSVSTAVTSSIAAVLWHLRPDLRPAQVMRLIDRSGELLNSRADFYAWRPLAPLMKPPRMRRVSLCRTILATCGPDGTRCPALEAINCQFWEHPPANLSQSNPMVWVPGPYPPADSPIEQLMSLGSLPLVVGTQPPENPCSTCTIVPDPPQARTYPEQEESYALLMEIDPQWQPPGPPTINSSIDRAVLVIACTAGQSPTRRTFDLSYNLGSPLPSRFTLGGIGTLRGCTASVDFRVTAGTAPNTEFRSVQSPVYIDP